MKRTYGEDIGSLTPVFAKRMQVCPEIELWYAINTLGGRIWRIQHDSADSRLEMTESMLTDLFEMQYAIEFMAAQSERFGTGVKIGDAHVERTEDYWKWFKWWHKYTDDLSDDDVRKISDLLEGDLSVEEFRPEGDWRV